MTVEELIIEMTQAEMLRRVEAMEKRFGVKFIDPRKP